MQGMAQLPPLTRSLMHFVSHHSYNIALDRRAPKICFDGYLEQQLEQKYHNVAILVVPDSLGIRSRRPDMRLCRKSPCRSHRPERRTFLGLTRTRMVWGTTRYSLASQLSEHPECLGPNTSLEMVYSSRHATSGNPVLCGGVGEMLLYGVREHCVKDYLVWRTPLLKRNFRTRGALQVHSMLTL